MRQYWELGKDSELPIQQWAGLKKEKRPPCTNDDDTSSYVHNANNSVDNLFEFSKGHKLYFTIGCEHQNFGPKLRLRLNTCSSRRSGAVTRLGHGN